MIEHFAHIPTPEPPQPPDLPDPGNPTEAGKSAMSLVPALNEAANDRWVSLLPLIALLPAFTRFKPSVQAEPNRRTARR